MRQAFAVILILSGLSAGDVSASPALSRDGAGSTGRFPAVPGWPLGRGLPSFGGAADTGNAGNPGVTAPLVTAPKRDAQPKPEPSAAARLDDLFQRLAHAEDSDEADGLAHAIERLWLQSGSDTADLLMVRAVAALGKGQPKVASDLLDKIVVVDPGWVEAWNKRATLRFLDGDDVGAMQDVAQVLSREPRHFGALSGMAAILHRNGMDKQALELARRTEAIYPHNAELEKLESELSLKVEGRDI